MSQLEFYTGLCAFGSVAWVPYIIRSVMVRGLMGALANRAGLPLFSRHN
jgi:hypothetical protein